MNSDDEMFSAANSDSEDEEDDDMEDADDADAMDNDAACDAMKPVITEDDEFYSDYPFEVLTPDKIVQHMVKCISEVNSVIQVKYLTFLVFYNDRFISCFS
jgi:ariadne-1